MSTSHPHTGGAPEPDAATGRGGAWYAPPDADDYPYTLRELRNHLNRLGYRARAGRVGGEDVRDMQARVAEFRDSLEQRRAGTARHPDDEERRWRAEEAGEHAARTRFYERRIHAALADMAAELRDESWPGQNPAGLDVASRAWLDQRFAALRRRLDDTLSAQQPVQAHSDICAALEDARQRLNVMERKLSDTATHQKHANRRIIALIDERTREPDTPQPDQIALKSVDARLQALQQGFDRAMGELDTMKRGTQQLAIRASATVARQTARATAQHVAKAVREAAPERRFTRLEQGLSECISETSALRQETGAIHQTLEDGLEDLRGRINELTLISRKALATPVQATPATPETAGSSDNSLVRSNAAFTPHTRPEMSAPARAGSRLMSRLGFAVVFVLLAMASFAMLYAQMSGRDWLLPAFSTSNGAPPSSSTLHRQTPTPTPEPASGERVIMPGIILTGAAPQQA